MKFPNFSRRELLKTGAALGGLELVEFLMAGCGGIPPNPGPGPSTCAKLTDIEHVVILIQENRSFDHYFGSYRGVRGYSEASAAFQQPFPGSTTNPPGVLLPFHMNSAATDAECTHDIEHSWIVQHQSWNNGLMNGFVTSHLPINAIDAVLTMGYYTRVDLPYYYAVADAFTICDHYFCSVIGPTDPNRLYTMAASIDPDGRNGGPLLRTLVGNRSSFLGKLTYTTMPEQLQARGISWKVYSAPDSNFLTSVFSNNVLSYFKNFQDPSSALYKNAFGPLFPVDFVADAISGNLPQVSWILAPIVAADHPPSPALFGENILAGIVAALTAGKWAKTVLFATYDENGGFFDHVPPVTAPAGTPGEFITAPAVPDPGLIGQPPIPGPIGLGPRVPMLVISPFSRGGFVSSDLFDHTSVLKFLEKRFGAEVPNLSTWRRATVGDMTTAFNFAAPNENVPGFPSPIQGLPDVIQRCVASLLDNNPPNVPNPQALPTQEAGAAHPPSGVC